MKLLKSLISTLMALSLLFLSVNAEQNLIATPGIDEGEEYLAFAEEMPSPVGGLPAIYKLVKYPKIAQQAGVEGKVYLLAFINEQGTVDDVKIIKGIGGGCDEAAAEAVKGSKFTPGKNKGKTVKVKFSVAIQFKL